MQLHRVNSFYDRQIDRALRGARVLCLSDYPRLVLFSDVHRGNGSWSDSFLNNKPLYEAALHYYDARDFACVELGDGDELSQIFPKSTVTYSPSWRISPQRSVSSCFGAITTASKAA